jgi:hypothetical protein
MHEAKYGVKSITVGAAELLLAAAGGGSAVHLAPLAKAGAVGQSAVPDYCFTAEAASTRPRPGLANYDPDALRAPDGRRPGQAHRVAVLGRLAEDRRITN